MATLEMKSYISNWVKRELVIDEQGYLTAHDVFTNFMKSCSNPTVSKVLFGTRIKLVFPGITSSVKRKGKTNVRIYRGVSYRHQQPEDTISLHDIALRMKPNWCQVVAKNDSSIKIMSSVGNGIINQQRVVKELEVYRNGHWNLCFGVVCVLTSGQTSLLSPGDGMFRVQDVDNLLRMVDNAEICKGLPLGVSTTGLQPVERFQTAEGEPEEIRQRARTCLWLKPALAHGTSCRACNRRLRYLRKAATLKPLHTKLSTEAMGKIRYVAGRCVAKLTSKHHNSWRRLMYAEGSRQKKLCKSTVETLNYLDCLTASYADLHKTSEMPETLEETARKQNIRQSLYNISDNAFRFFLLLEKHRVHLETKGRFDVEQQDVISVVEAQLLDTAELKETWRALFLSTDVTESASLDTLFRKIVHSFVLVASNYFRKDLIRSYGQKKMESHRRQIQMRHQKEKDLTAKLSSAKIAADTSKRKQVTHLQLQSILKSNPNFFSARTYSKEELKTFFKAYTLPWQTRRLKTQLAEDLCAKILAVDNMSEPNGMRLEHLHPSARLQISCQRLVMSHSLVPLAFNTIH
ncbi:PREDICTED: uncharacterized protein LOC106806018 [Priapulus caudatus]|uniref:Uncharacterized protein LOC106806018 n=1 Tax=Priapulus caudatus TaxID=37621 RepID=A0ABM1DTR0_PRICU|nr:PREDICTED: uncharacterized protein LOC106806018 [Priapulus caudatus]